MDKLFLFKKAVDCFEQEKVATVRICSERLLRKYIIIRKALVSIFLAFICLLQDEILGFYSLKFKINSWNCQHQIKGKRFSSNLMKQEDIWFNSFYTIYWLFIFICLYSWRASLSSEKFLPCFWCWGRHYRPITYIFYLHYLFILSF